MTDRSSQAPDARTVDRKKAVGYIRVSSPSQAREGESLATQREAIEAFCRLKSWDLTGIFADDGISGASTKKRPGLLDLLAEARDGKFECLVIHRLSRFGRNARELLNNVTELDRNGVKLISLKENIDFSNSYGRFMVTMLAAVAELEREIIREQMSESKMARWKDNRAFIGQPPFAYRWNKASQKIEIDPKEAEVYRRIISMYLNEGMTYRDIGIRLMEEGVRCKRAMFKDATLQYILKNPAYYGNYIANQYQYEGNKRTKELKPAQEHISFPFPPLISKVKWDAIQAKVESNKVKGKRITASRDYWLRDLLVCGECGAVIKPSHGSYRKDGTFPRYYTCYWSQASEKELRMHKKARRCRIPYIKAEELEEAVWFDVIKHLSFGGFEILGEYYTSKLEKLIDPVRYDRQIAELEEQSANLTMELKKKETVRTRLFSLLEVDDFYQEEFYAKMRENDEGIARVSARLLEIQDRITTLIEAKNNEHEFVEFVRGNSDWLRSIQEELFRLSPDDKKRFIESLVDGKIRVSMGLLEEGQEGPEWFMEENYRLSFNQAIFERLASEGKISGLDLNGSHRHAAPDLRGGPRNLQGLQPHGPAPPGPGPGPGAPLPLPPSHHLRRRAHRGRHHSPAGGGEPGPQRRAVPG
jgi:DNA invertase Pin-like site-specific DNA recombinase